MDDCYVIQRYSIVNNQIEIDIIGVLPSDNALKEFKRTHLSQNYHYVKVPILKEYDKDTVKELTEEVTNRLKKMDEEKDRNYYYWDWEDWNNLIGKIGK